MDDGGAEAVEGFYCFRGTADFLKASLSSRNGSRRTARGLLFWVNVVVDFGGAVISLIVAVFVVGAVLVIVAGCKEWVMLCYALERKRHTRTRHGGAKRGHSKEGDKEGNLENMEHGGRHGVGLG